MAFALIAIALSEFGAANGDDKNPPLVQAAEKNDLQKVARLLAKGHEVNQQQADGMTALHWSVFHRNEKMTQSLLEAKAKVDVVNRYGIPVLSIACTNGDGAIVKLLLKAGADPQTTIPGGETVLMTASRTGRLEVVELLISQGANVNSKGPRRQTALMWAAAEGNLKVVDRLLREGADFKTPLSSGFTPLFFAIREGRTSVALRLLKAGIDVNAPMKRNNQIRSNPLLMAVENAHYETALALIDAGADPNAQPRGYGVLHAITWVRKPIRGDGNPSPVGSRKISDLEFVKSAVEKGADVNLRLAKGKSGYADFTTTGCSPFVLAARTGDLPLLRTLISLKADPSIANKDRSTALLAACGVGDLGSGQQTAGSEAEAIETAKLLLKMGADVNAVDKNGETAIHGASYQNWPRLIEFLAKNGADIKSWNKKNRWGWTPLTIARGYRKGNFRPDTATINMITKVMLANGFTPPPLRKPNKANQQSWDKKKAVPKKSAGTKKGQSKK